MKVGRFGPYVVLAVLATGLPGCGMFRSAMVPDDPGLYAVTSDDDLQRLDGPPDWEQETWAERSDLGRDVRFVVAHPSLAEAHGSLADVIQLRQVGWLRSEIGPGGEIAPVEGVKWVAPSLEDFRVPLDFAEVDDRDDVIEARPRGALEPGLYALELRAGTVEANARLGVQWTGLDQRQYASTHCVDRYAAGSPTFRRCSDQVHAEALDGLQLHLVDPERQSVGDGEVLVVRGLVVNTSAEPRQVPTLQAVLLGSDAQPLHSWPFVVASRELAPGQSVSFETSTDALVTETATVRVEFAPQIVVQQ